MKILLKYGKLLDGDSLYVSSDVLVDGDRIVKVAAQIEDKADRVIDLGGCTLMPGFIDAHVHVAVDDSRFKTDAVSAWAHNGVTTVRELGMLSTLTDGDYAKWLAEVNQNPKYARVVATGKYIDVPGGYGAGPNPMRCVGNMVSTADEAAAMVTRAYELGFPGIKIGVSGDGTGKRLSEEMMKAVCDRAHSHGMWVAVHITKCAPLEMLIKAGIDESGHTPEDDMSDALIAEMVEKGIPMNSTLGDPDSKGPEMMPPMPGGMPDMPPMLGGPGGPGGPGGMDMGARREVMIKNLQKFHKAGGMIIASTDLIHAADFKKSATIPVHELDQLMNKVGLTLTETIMTATANAAKVIGAADEGYVRPGMKANLVAVGGQVDERFKSLLEPKLVINRGTIIVE